MDHEPTMHELPGIGVTWVEPGSLGRAAHAVSGRHGSVWLIDVYDWEPGIAAAMQLGEPAGVVQLLDRHGRDNEKIANRIGVPLLRLSRPAPAGGGGLSMPSDFPFSAINLIARRGWYESALWDSRRELLIVPELLGTSPLYATGAGRAGVHPLARPWPPRSFERLQVIAPESLLCGHGPPLASGAAHDVHLAIERARRDIPSLLVKMPKLAVSGSSGP